MAENNRFKYLEDEECKARLITLRKAVSPILANNLLRHFTDHTVSHSDYVAYRIDELIEPLQEGRYKLTDRELFICYASCYLHDIGMQYEAAGTTQTIAKAGLAGQWNTLTDGERADHLRRLHHELSAEMITQSVRAPRPLIGIALTDDDEPDLIASLCEAHALDTKNRRYGELIREDRPGLRMELLIGLLRMADILEETQRRANRDKAETLSLPLVSQVHWWRHYYTREIEFNANGATVTVWFDFPTGLREEYTRLVLPLQFQEIESEYKRHAVTFAKYKLEWLITRDFFSGQHGRKLEMPPEVKAEMEREVKMKRGTAAGPSLPFPRLLNSLAISASLDETHPLGGVKYRWIPSELEGKFYPFNPLLESSHFGPFYLQAEKQALGDLSIDASTGYSQHLQWQVTFRTIHNFITQAAGMLGHGEEAVKTLAEAWASRHFAFEDSSINSRVETLLASGLFVADSTYTEAVPVAPVAGAVSAFLDGYFLSLQRHDSEGKQAVLRYLLETARSRRRLPTDLQRNARTMTSWLALLISVNVATEDIASEIVDMAASVDMPLAMDLYAILSLRHGQQSRPVLSKVLRWIQEQGSTVPVLYPGPLDPEDARPQNFNVAWLSDAKPYHTKGFLRQMPDADLLTTLLIASSIPLDRQLLDEDLWQEVIPSGITNALRKLGTRLRIESIHTTNGILISKSVLLISDLMKAFPGMRRSHRPADKVARVSWLTATILAFGCGGRLPTKEEAQALVEEATIQQIALGPREIAFEYKALEPLDRMEWLSDPKQPVIMGHEFQRNPPVFFDRLVQRGHWYRSEGVRSLADSLTIEKDDVTAKPQRGQLAALRLVFDT